jgi:hypothetical protein
LHAAPGASLPRRQPLPLLPDCLTVAGLARLRVAVLRSCAMASAKPGHTLQSELHALEAELSKDWAHAKHFMGDMWGHLEHVRAL